jgi:predicted nuclease with TOPRIM domain
MSEEQTNLFGEKLPDQNAKPIRKRPQKKHNTTRPKISTQTKKGNDEFLKELQEMDSVAIIKRNNAEPKWHDEILEATSGDNENLIKKLAEEEEFKKLQEELKQDEADGFLLSEAPFYLKDQKLHIRRHQDQVQANIANLAKGVIDSKWKQNIDPKNIIVEFDLSKEGEVVYEAVICVSEYGVRFRVILQDILDKLNKIPFE